MRSYSIPNFLGQLRKHSPLKRTDGFVDGYGDLDRAGTENSRLPPY